MTLYSSDLISRIQNEVDFEAVRSRGPGGQNVNKVSSAAVMTWNYLFSPLLNAEQKNLIQEKLSSMINKEGEVFLRSDEYRDLTRNKERCLEKLDEFLKRAFHKEKLRKASRPTKASKRKKKENKSRHSQTKKSRQRPEF